MIDLTTEKFTASLFGFLLNSSQSNYCFSSIRVPVGRGRISVGLGSRASLASHCATRGENLSRPQSSDLDKGGWKSVPEAFPPTHPAPWPSMNTSFLLISLPP